MSIEDEITLINMMITHPAGFDVDIAGLLWVRRYEHPVWAVEEEIDSGKSVGKIKVKEFEDPLKAAEYFVKRRHELEIGIDYDIIHIKESQI